MGKRFAPILVLRSRMPCPRPSWDARSPHCSSRVPYTGSDRAVFAACNVFVLKPHQPAPSGAM